MKLIHTKILLSLILGLSLLLGACSSPVTPAPAATPTLSGITSNTNSTSTSAPLTFTDGLGRTVTLAAPAKRIVSLSPYTTEIVSGLGASRMLVGRDDASDYPDVVKNLPSVGGANGKYDMQAIANLKPDLVLAGGVNTEEQVKALQDLGLTVYYAADAVDFESLFENIVTISTMIDREPRGQGVVRELNARVSYIQEKVQAATDHPLVYYEQDASDPANPTTAGPASLADFLITTAGGTNIGAGLDGEWAQISQATILQENPDYILLGDGVTPESVARRPGWGALKAVQEGHVIVVDKDTFTRPTARLVDGLETLAKLLHGDLLN